MNANQTTIRKVKTLAVAGFLNAWGQSLGAGDNEGAKGDEARP